MPLFGAVAASEADGLQTILAARTQVGVAMVVGTVGAAMVVGTVTTGVTLVVTPAVSMAAPAGLAVGKVQAVQRSL